MSENDLIRRGDVLEICTDYGFSRADECRDGIAALPAAPTFTAADLERAWQPIETAPKNNAARLVYVPENKCTYCVAWREDEEYPWGGAWVIFGGGYRDHIGRATHWMPLPPPPAAGPTCEGPRT